MYRDRSFVPEPVRRVYEGKLGLLYWLFQLYRHVLSALVKIANGVDEFYIR